MISGKNGSAPSLRRVVLCLLLPGLGGLVFARTPLTTPSDLGMKVVTTKKTTSQDDSFIIAPAKDLALQHSFLAIEAEDPSRNLSDLG